jgi:Spy/CpxP family protein refolding chaperone
MFRKVFLFTLILIVGTFVFAGMQQEKRRAHECTHMGDMASEPGCMGDMQGPHMGEHGFGMWMFPGKWWKDPNIQKELKLSDDQINKLDDLLMKHKKEMIDIRANIQKKQIDLEQLLDKENGDENIIMQKANELITLRGELQKMYIKMILDMRKILTPEQNKKLKEIRALARTKIRERLRTPHQPDNPPPPVPPPEGLF